jgi:hypothetical protein
MLCAVLFITHALQRVLLRLLLLPASTSFTAFALNEPISNLPHPPPSCFEQTLLLKPRSPFALSLPLRPPPPLLPLSCHELGQYFVVRRIPSTFSPFVDILVSFRDMYHCIIDYKTRSS